MPNKRNLQLLRSTLLIFAGVSILYGILHLFFPVMYVEASNGGPVSPAWIRFFGPILISLGIGAILVYRNPVKQGIVIFMFAFGSYTTAFTQLYSIYFDFEGLGVKWDTASPMIVNFVIAILFTICLRQNKDILW